MGGMYSKQSSKQNPHRGRSKGQEKQYSQRQSKVGMAPSAVQNTMENESQTFTKKSAKLSRGDDNDDVFYDGIPRYRHSSPRKSRSSRVSEVSSFLGRAGSVGIGRAVKVLDTLGTSVTSLNSNTDFVSKATTKNTELSILAFEVANTIVKASKLMQSLSKKSIHQLKEVVLAAESVHKLVSTDMNVLLEIVAEEKREELKVFSEEVIRFGNRCKDSQWHNLNRFFEKRSRESNPQKLSEEVAESVMEQLMILIQLTAELYQELHILDKLKQDYQERRLEEIKHSAAQKGDRDSTINIVAGELKSQKKLVKLLKKRSLWSRSMEEIMGQLVDIVLFLNQKINTTFGNSAKLETLETGTHDCRQTLGQAGLGLHYANIILQIDSIVARSSSMTPNSRGTLYQSLPPNMKVSLRSKLQSFKVERELTVTEIKDEMEKTLHWLVPTATSTAKDHHGFGWVGEWANTGSQQNRRNVGPSDVMKIETLYHADRMKIEAYILDLLLWLNYLVSRSKSSAKGNSISRPSVTPVCSPYNESDERPAVTKATNDQELEPDVHWKTEALNNTGKNDNLNLDESKSTSDNALTDHGLGNYTATDMIS